MLHFLQCKFTYTHTHIYVYIYVHIHTCLHIQLFLIISLQQLKCAPRHQLFQRGSSAYEKTLYGQKFVKHCSRVSAGSQRNSRLVFTQFLHTTVKVTTSFRQRQRNEENYSTFSPVRAAPVQRPHCPLSWKQGR
jgi:hypothetical protein